METIPDGPDCERSECPVGCPHCRRLDLWTWRCSGRKYAEGIGWPNFGPLACTPDDQPLRSQQCLRAGLPEGCEEARDDG